MKVSRTCLAGLAAVAAFSASVWAGDVFALRARVPFEFNVGDQVLPAGEYQFSKNWSPRTIQISSLNTKTSVTVIHSTGGRGANRLGDAVVFNRYGDQYFLREMWIAGEEGGAQLPRSRAEKRQLDLARSPAREVLSASAIR